MTNGAPQITTTETVVSIRKEEIVKEAKRIEESTLYSSKGHYAAAAFWQRLHFWLGIPTTVLAAIAAASAFAQFDKNNVPGGIISLIVAALSALSTFVNGNERAGAHFDAANKYEALNNDARMFWTIDCHGPESEDVLTLRLKDLSERKNQLSADSPQIPGFAYRQAKRGIEAGESDFKVDKPTK